jgi:hypothetical protein
MVCRKLIELDLLERLAGEVITALIHIRIENHVQESCKGSFDTSYISSLESVSMVGCTENVLLNIHIQQHICSMLYTHFLQKAHKMMCCVIVCVAVYHYFFSGTARQISAKFIIHRYAQSFLADLISVSFWYKQ